MSAERLRAWARVMAIVMLCVALAPTVSRARAWVSPGANFWADICTTGDLASPQRVAPAWAASSSLNPGEETHLDHCPLCWIGAQRWAPPPAPWQWQPLPASPLVWLPVHISFSLAPICRAPPARAPPMVTPQI